MSALVSGMYFCSASASSAPTRNRTSICVRTRADLRPLAPASCQSNGASAFLDQLTTAGKMIVEVDVSQSDSTQFDSNVADLGWVVDGYVLRPSTTPPTNPPWSVSWMVN